MPEPVVITRDYDAPPARVFAGWTNVDLLTQWFGCATDMLWDVHEWDARPGGAIHVSLDFETGPYVVKGRFIEVDEPNRIRYEWEGDQVVTVTIQANGKGSRMTLEHAGLPSNDLCEIVTDGWSASTTQILAVLS